MEEGAKTGSPDTDYELSALSTDKSTRKFFPREGPLPTGDTEAAKKDSTITSSRFLNVGMAVVRWAFYRPLPAWRFRKGWRPVVFPSIGVITIVSAALVFVVLYCFVPQPLYWQSIRFGSPPLAIRAGMIAVAMMPWIVALSMKANFISMLTGIGHERLNVLHRWLAYMCLLLSLIHTVPFYITPIWEKGGVRTFKTFFQNTQGYYVYGSGIAALVPLVFLCVHSLPPLRRRFYELFVTIHVPAAIVLLGMLFWHCRNYLTSWNYLFATVGIWGASYAVRLFYLNWTNPWRMSWLIGEEAAVTLLPENAMKITIPTQVRWKPGHDDFPSAYGEDYRDMVIVFRPFGGFTKRVLESALEHGPWHTYRAFIDGPYGGMRRRVDSFDHVVMFAGGSGITALVSQLLDLVKRIRDGKAVTKTVHVVWAMKRPETLEWFKEELRICKEFAPPETVTCQFYITSAKRMSKGGTLVSAATPTRPVSMIFHDKVNDLFQNVASNRYSMSSAQRNSMLIRDEAEGDPEKEKELREENNDRLRPLPQAHLKPMTLDAHTHLTIVWKKKRRTCHRILRYTRSDDRDRCLQAAQDAIVQQSAQVENPQEFDFGFPSTPTEFQKNLMRFAFMPAAVKSRKTGWSTEWGRPDIPYMLKEMSEEWTGRRTCVFVCGPPGMRVDVSNTVAELQSRVWKQKDCEEIFLHAENYAL
ncbi:putative FRE ferric reductase-like transmembrane component [Hortaea werneckii]|nr:putative FRE ferric reductase-like transmembrane component [Hortaea werneckii]